MILLIDNYDSFVFNLARYLQEMGQETCVVRNDRITVGEVLSRQADAIVLSPGPCTPQTAGISLELIRSLPEACPFLGVCLGHQAIAAAFGGRVVRAPEPVHGRTSGVHHDGRGLFQNIPSPFLATRYHSLIVEEATLPAELSITARTPDGLPMALVHNYRPIYGVQFHPESVLTQHGRDILKNFLHLAGLPTQNSSPGEFIAPAITRDKLPTPAQTQLPLHW